MEDFRRILVVTGTTKEHQKAVHYGVSLARSYDAELYIVNFVHNPFGMEGWNLPVPDLKTLEDDYLKMRRLAKADLDAMVEKEKATGLPIKEIIGEGDPVKHILKVIKEEQIDLVILLAHQVKHIEHHLSRHSREAILREMPCSVLVLKA